MSSSVPRFGVVIYTHNRVDDARINMEIIRSLWTTSGLFKTPIPIVHAFNGDKQWWPKRYLEDVLVRQKNPGHFQGASELIDAGLSRMHKQFPDVSYVLVLAADTWMTKPSAAARILSTMVREQQYLATSAWNAPKHLEMKEVGIATDCLFLHLPWAYRFGMLPIGYEEFWNRHSEMILYAGANSVMLEKLAFARFKQALWRDPSLKLSMLHKIRARLLELRERGRVHARIRRDGTWERTHHFPKIGLLTHHDAIAKHRIFKNVKNVSGPTIERFLKTKKLRVYPTT